MFILILVILWMLIIFLFSSQNKEESKKTSDGFIIKVCNIFISKKLSKKEKERLTKKYHFIARKLAHFSIYLVLGILIISLLMYYNVSNPVLIGIIGCLLYASSDEFHQTFVKGRTGCIKDVIIDTCGSIVGILSYYFIFK